MKVKMLVSMSGPDESWKHGDEREVPDAVAKEWQTEGIATIIPGNPVVVQGETVVDVDKLRSELDALGVKYHHKAGAAKLAELLADAKAKTKAQE